MRGRKGEIYTMDTFVRLTTSTTTTHRIESESAETGRCATGTRLVKEKTRGGENARNKMRRA